MHWQLLTVRETEISTWVKFLHDIAKKASLATHKALAEFVNTNDVELGKERERYNNRDCSVDEVCISGCSPP